jgi:amidase
MVLLGKGYAVATLAASAPSALLPSAAQAEIQLIKPTNELIYVSAAALAKAIRDKQVSSAEVVNAYLQHIETVNPELNAIVQLTAETARAQAREADAVLARGELKGPLHGVPFTVKDTIETAGVICTSGHTLDGGREDQGYYRTQPPLRCPVTRNNDIFGCSHHSVQ